jgi:hypothetical protein
VVEKADSSMLTDMMVRLGRLSLLVLLGILGSFILFGQDFVRLWVGETYRNSWLIALITMVAYTIPLIQNFANSLLEANNRVYFKAITYFALIGLGTALGAFMTNSWNEMGMIWGITIGWMAALFVVNIYYHKVLHLNIIAFFQGVCYRILPVFMLSLVVGWAIQQIPGNGWLLFMTKTVVYVMVYMGLMYKFAMNQWEMSILKSSMNFKK